MIEIARRRLLGRLDEHFPLVILEGVAGAGKRTLLRQWAMAPSTARVRALVEFDPLQPSQPAVLAQILHALERQAVDVPAVAYRRLLGAAGPGDGFPVLESVIGPLGGGVDLGLIGYERLPPDVFGGLAAVHRRLPLLRVVMETTDALDPCGRPAADVQPLTTNRQEELSGDPGEVAALLDGLGEPAAQGAADALWRATGGHSGLTAAAVGSAPRECLSGTISRSEVLRRWWAWQDEPMPFERHVRQTAVTPRFTLSEVRGFTGGQRAREHTERMVVLGLGEMRAHPRLTEPVFAWDEDVRQVVLRAEDPEASSFDLRRLAGAARQAGDHDLAVVAFVRVGDLDAAEAVVRAALRETLSTGDLAVWEPVLRLPPGRFDRHPGLQLVRLVLARRSGTASGRLAGQLGGFARRLADRQAGDPLDRLWLLALAARAWCEAGELGPARACAVRWIELAADVHGRLVAEPGRVGSMAVGMIEVLVQLDRLPDAAGAADLVIESLEAGEPEFGLADDWRATALRARRCVAAVVDRTAPGDRAAAVLPVRAGEGSELDEVLVAVHRAWELLDAGDLDEAERITRLAVQRSSRPAIWPILLLTRAIALIGGRRHRALEQLWLLHLENRDWRRRQFTTGPVGGIAAILDTLVPLALGRRRPAGGPDGAGAGPAAAVVRHYLGDEPHRLAPVELERLSRRVKELALSLETLTVLRAGDLPLATEILAMVCGQLPESGSLPLAFAFAEPQEVDRLAAAHDHPGAACRRHLELARQLAAALPKGAGAVDLSGRERELLAQLRRGTPNREIASALFVSVNTVKFHRANLYRKLGATTREEALAAALRLGL
ncbi:MAG: LuxR C-terminal-related transcriptional regulator [Propionicimonas sp.]|nr:LuxR C-terminal-related transcriptional regulator [Propionicimonas sp.]